MATCKKNWSSKPGTEQWNFFTVTAFLTEKLLKEENLRLYLYVNEVLTYRS